MTGLSVGAYALAVGDPTDVVVWQGQYFIGDKFQTGTYEFNFVVYDASSGGTQCYANTITLTTGRWGEWKTEQPGVSTACNDTSKSYFLEISINGERQLPRRRLTVLNFIRKNIDETTSGSIIAPYFRALFGVKELNKDVWSLKLLYAEEHAKEILAAQEELALARIAAAKEITDKTVGESLELKRERLITAGAEAKAEVIANARIAKAIILQARELTKLNGETLADTSLIEETAQTKIGALNALAAEKSATAERVVNTALAGLTDDGIKFCFSDGTNCRNISSFKMYVVADETSRDALNNLRAGDIAIVTGSNASFIYTQDGVWQQLLTPTSNLVFSVNGQTGTVVLNSDDVAEGALHNYFTPERARGAFSVTDPLSYDALSGILGVVANPAFNNVGVNNLTVGGGASIAKFLSVTQTNIVSASIASRTCGDYATISVAGATFGSSVLATPRPVAGGIETANLSWNTLISAANTVVIRACNPTTGAINTPNTQTWTIDVWMP